MLMQYGSDVQQRTEARDNGWDMWIRDRVSDRRDSRFFSDKFADFLN